ncbi:Maltose/maltodextrin import ATP-binding protein MalK [Tritonibacter multivorans]|uniref:Maltose/maltodextrin import ATP-binding protein MalK n=1 Tax=Tritonibacter multivorans TaxID=928856 RepID=A0A0N7LZG8_9RHOB|nr:sn-glycerol-3-phosphate ABC transporter ATP-binding protein UgpC [Tritonibacter multivorans]MDA7421149.1 sn-glycerol-3-phosphate ABC transporter ATP-binding protein UgpC [Tritonibacter multivorans]CUH77625.1 Maltose/maltodextrin import ATP-binding protein MalK [Tritonibacter multivorans]SFD34702.1 carbohydrate ABC transporter ATP-binding protein, CUT1 family [Tritonibacter multivorans]
MTSIQLKNIKKSYGKTEVIHGIDLDIPSGEFCVFVGPSGCGKSTLLRMIAGLEDVTAGDLLIDGARVNGISAAKRGLAMVFQSYALYPHMSVRKNLSFGLENINLPKAEIKSRVEDAARMLQIDGYLDRKPGQLSGGQRQRVAIGRAVVREPRAFLFDEPLSNLDAELRVATRGEISALHQRLGNTMIYVTHDQVEAMTMADKIAVLRAGRLEQFGAPLELYNAPANMFVAGFIGSPRMNFLKAGLIAGAGQTILRLQDGQDIALSTDRFGRPASRPAVMGIRPGDLEITDSDAPLHMQVTAVEQLGSESILFGTSPCDEELVVTARGQTAVRVGDRLNLRPNPDAIHVFDAQSEESLALQ